jgi:hypothetical protein
MKVQVNTDSSVRGDLTLEAHVADVLERTLHRFGDQISRLEVHLTDTNGGKAGSDDKRCVVEARIEGRRPEAVTHTADNFRDAIHGSAAKMERLLDTIIGKRQNHR